MEDGKLRSLEAKKKKILLLIKLFFFPIFPASQFPSFLKNPSPTERWKLRS
jgi:hypothetical protein